MILVVGLVFIEKGFYKPQAIFTKPISASSLLKDHPISETQTPHNQ
jgi:hypothetical protein